MTPTVFWVIAIVVFAIVEGVTVGLASIWFVAGALAALIVSLFISNIWIQAAVFLLVSILSLAAFKPLVERYLTPKDAKRATNLDSIIGREAVVREDICNLENRGQVKIKGLEWSALSETGEDIPAGTVVVVDRIEGVRVYVHPVPVESASTQA
ncbi:MAG: NfeD family protein [Clostridiales bacterium]|nr:NfeD family protein [Clostridiales bacterium]